MKILKLSLKNLFVNWWRTFTMGVFIFVGSMLLVVLGCFSATIKSNMEDAIRNSVTGDIQLRPSASSETDMLDVAGNWSKLEVIGNDEAKRLMKVIEDNLEYEEYVGRVRQNVIIQTAKGRQLTMLAGLDKDITQYSDAIDLKQGRLLDINRKNEIVISGLVAENLNIELGQEIDVIAQSEQGEDLGNPVVLKMKVVGIGDLKLLSGFSVSVLYTGIEQARYLSGYTNGEYTDIIIYTGKKHTAKEDAQKLRAALAGTHPDEDYKGSYGSYQAYEGNQAYGSIKVTTWVNMGKFIMDGISVNVIMFYSFIVIFMFIITILIVNLIYMIGLEKRQQVGTLRAIGFGRWQIVKIFLAEIMLAAVFFCITGIGAGTAIVLIIGRIGLDVAPPMDFFMGKHFIVKYYPQQSGIIFTIMMVFSMLAAFYPSARAAGVKPVDTLKET